MKNKSTDELIKVIEKEPKIQKYLANNQDEFDYTSLADALNHLKERSRLSKANIAKLANADRIYTYQIFNGTKLNPSRDKIVALCIALQASLSETQYILRLGHAEQLHPRKVRDSIFIHAIKHHSSVDMVNEALEDVGEHLLF